jgi:hypothetical protein
MALMEMKQPFSQKSSIGACQRCHISDRANAKQITSTGDGCWLAHAFCEFARNDVGETNAC